MIIDDIKMEDYENVFISTIIRNEKTRTDELYDLLKVTPAIPLAVTKDDSHTCNFCPKTGKHYIPKKKSKLKVKTVREIRNGFELDTYVYLSNDLVKQQNVLLKKIRDDTLLNESTKSLATKMLKSEQPLSRTTWLMLANVNPEGNRFSTQFVLWNGKHIQINGSKGGKSKFISNIDIGHLKHGGITYFKKKVTNKRNGLLRSSLSIQFKPGPLGKKKYLDNSHQKYHVGGIELIDLPKAGLDIQPVYGAALDPTITRFINNLRDKDGVISKKWAEFSVSVLGKQNKSASPIQLSKENISFDLGYVYDQHRILMRRDCDNSYLKMEDTTETSGKCQLVLREDDSIVMSEIKEMVNKMLNSIEISLEQDNMFSNEDPRLNCEDAMCSSSKQTPVKDKTKRKYGELDRLDVTIIQMPENQSRDSKKKCDKSYCVLGCICDTLECRFKIKQHCGRIGCMFECKCDFSKCSDSLQSECSSILPGLINLNDQINSKLSKEEQKFHQTVIVTGEKSILLKSQKRNSKISKKYADFYTNMSFKTHVEIPKMVSISCLKINCKNVEPWCMVHNLYKCFCKGKFVERCNIKPVTEITNNTLVLNDTSDGNILKDNGKNLRSRNRSAEDELIKRDSSTKELSTSTDELINRQSNESLETIELDTNLYSKCARTKGYRGRKYTDGYYMNTNRKILEMEKNDHALRKRMAALMVIDADESIANKKYIVNTTFNDDEKCQSSGIDESISLADEVESPPLETHKVQLPSKECAESCDETITTFTAKHLPDKKNLALWLECNYKLYKQRMDQGLTTALNPPKLGKVALHSWEFILNRYRERKNHFLVTKQSPYRIFVAVNAKHPFFEYCLNIDDIRFADIEKYPITVKNLLTNANYNKNSFCILSGLSFCWELISSVTKLNEFQNKCQIEKAINLDNCSEITPNNLNITSQGNETHLFKQNEGKNKRNELHTKSPTISNMSVENKNSEISKWFVMTIENDFTEIQFYKRGFFMKLESIMRAINVARVSKKTVRLSSQKCVDNSNGPQFGLYAIPNTSEHCVFIGPYDIDESLGIETVKSLVDVRKTKKTRGIWIITNTVDNLKVIDNPMSFILPKQYQEMIPLDSHNSSITTLELKRKEETPKKSVKPIKVRKTDGFFLTSKGTIQKISPHKIVTNNGKSLLLNTSACAYPALKSKLEGNSLGDTDCDESIPESEITHKRSERGMFILKPEEINKKLLDSKLLNKSDVLESNNTDPSIIDLDIEQFITSTTMYMPSTSNSMSISLISDDEEDQKVNVISDEEDVFIQSTNIKCLGWIKAKRKMGLISFQFPGFLFSPYYSVKETFSKINEVLSRMIYVPKNIQLMWEVVESVDESKSELKSDNLSSDFILTKQGIQHKENFGPRKDIIKTYSRKLLKDLSLDLPPEDSMSSDSMDETNYTITETDKRITRLEDEQMN